jgi:putative spermidine/putrescine transport system permease protein
MYLGRLSRSALALAVLVGLAFIYIPLGVVVINSFNAAKVFSWPPTHWTLHWWTDALGNDGVRAALATSVRAGLGATAIAIVLGTALSFALVRYDFFGRSSINFLVVLPISLPGIVTGIALNTSFTTLLRPLGINLGLFTVVLGHATFCIVVVFNNVSARLRRTGTSLEEASSDLGASLFQTFRYVTLPQLRSAIVAGALLAFALSFDEIVVTTFTSGPGVQTLPQWIFNNLFRPNQGPIVNAVAALLLIIFVAPVWLAERLSGNERTTHAGRM